MAALTAQEIDIKLIDPPAGGKWKNYDPTQTENSLFIEGMEKQGMLNPVSLRPTENGRYELVCGQKRIWSAKRLKWEKVQAIVGEWPDDQVGFVKVIENLHRKQMSANEKAKAMRAMLVEYEKAYGADPGRAIGGNARADDAARSTDGTFSKQPNPPDPANASPAFAGSPNEVPHESTAKKPKTFAKRTAEITSQSERTAQEDLLIARSFTNEQLEALDTCDLGKSDLLALARIKYEEVRKRAVNLVCSGIAVSEAIQRVEPKKPTKPAPEPKPEPKPEPEPEPEVEITVTDFARLYCSRQLTDLQDPARFLSDLTLYIQIIGALGDFKRLIGARVQIARLEGYSPMSFMLYKTLSISHPSQWYICAKCLGANVTHADCKECRGAGYRLRHDNEKVG